ncbi:hypothetical protein FEM48_Zijuj12G0198400 [Ziziphus jujuba var. spinosa]|uniref:Bet v I/Major latex protein domain-containing protein n=1 Tax=Ziziphus jujuba var. spinosa TaxID=714518 RepID=A0A978UF81_ZIZJJ|nr:hypothetical protein FEM48_Zijuj12G0198400 [Ziziphus jujuba var. spinosa]
MGVLAVESESTSAIAPARLFKALILDSDNLVPKILPQAIKSIEIVSGDGGAGTIKKIHFGEASQFKHVVHQIDAVDSENFTYSYSVIEGDVLGDLLEKISYDTKIVAGPNGGSIVKNTSTYYIKGDNQLSEEQVKEGKEKASGLFKAVEAYLVANPDAYN